MNPAEQAQASLPAVRIRGTSMNRSGVTAGDVLIFDPDRWPQSGDIVVAEVAGQGTTVKRLRRSRIGYGTPGRAWLVPESDDPRWRPTLVDESVRIVGVVVGIQWGGAGEVDQEIPGPRPFLFGRPSE